MKKLAPIVLLLFLGFNSSGHDDGHDFETNEGLESKFHLGPYNENSHSAISHHIEATSTKHYIYTKLKFGLIDNLYTPEESGLFNENKVKNLILSDQQKKCIYKQYEEIYKAKDDFLDLFVTEYNLLNELYSNIGSKHPVDLYKYKKFMYKTIGTININFSDYRIQNYEKKLILYEINRINIVPEKPNLTSLDFITGYGGGFKVHSGIFSTNSNNAVPSLASMTLYDMYNTLEETREGPICYIVDSQTILLLLTPKIDLLLKNSAIISELSQKI